LQGETLYEVLFKTEHPCDHIKLSGFLCHVDKYQRHKDKLGSCSKRCIFMDHPHGEKCRKGYDSKTGDVFVSHEMVFHKNSFRFHVKTNEDMDRPTFWEPTELNNVVTSLFEDFGQIIR